MAPSEIFQWPEGLKGCFPRAALRPRSKEWSAKIVVSVHAASFLIGRGGKKVQQLQEDSGARLLLRQGIEAPAGIHADDRLIEVHGGAEELEDGLFVVLTELDRIPEALAPRVACLLVPPGCLAAECLTEATEIGAHGRLLDVLIGGEQVLELAGTVKLRVQASTAVTSLLARRLWLLGGNRGTPAVTETRVAAGVSNRAPEIAVGLAHKTAAPREGTSHTSDVCDAQQAERERFQVEGLSHGNAIDHAPQTKIQRDQTESGGCEDFELHLLLPAKNLPLSGIAWHCGISVDIVGSDMITGHLRVRLRGHPAGNAFATLLLQIAQRW